MFLFKSPSPSTTDLAGPSTLSFGDDCRHVEHDRVKIPANFTDPGVVLTKISRKRGKTRNLVFKLDDKAIYWKTHVLLYDSIKDIRTGAQARNYREEYKVSDSLEHLWCSIIYSDKKKLKTLHILADGHVSGIIASMVHQRRDLMKSLSVPSDEEFARVHWSSTDTTTDVLTFEEVVKLCSRFHITCSTKMLHDMFVQADLNHNGLLNFEEFQRFVKLLKTRPEVQEIFTHYAGTSSVMNAEQFTRFLNHQGDSETMAMEHTVDSFTSYLMNCSYLRRRENDLSHPLNMYYISSSHNTYLLGRQLADQSSVEGYIQALQRGCRCVEVDIWDGDDGEPMISHGKLTTRIELKEVMEVIDKYAFIATPLPLIISFEIHCNQDTQVKILNTCESVFGDKLVTLNGDGLPSPQELKHRILLKIKKNSALPEVQSSSSSTDVEELFPQMMQRSSTKTIIPALNSIAAIHGLKFKNFSLPESKTPDHCFSLNEKKFQSLCKDQALSIDKHNRQYLMRVYPHALRYNSTNFSPIKFWALGVQMVALNWQTFDSCQQLNEAMFDIDDEMSGYVLKPESLRNPVKKKQLSAAEPLEIDSLFELQVISAQLLQKPSSLSRLDPYVTVEVFDSGNVSTCHTSTVHDNGFSPVWNTKMKFRLSDPLGLNFVRIIVKSGDTTLGVFCGKIDYLLRGYRHLPLSSDNGEKYIFSKLFVRIGPCI